MESVKKNKSEPVERLTLQKTEQEKLSRWIDELNLKFEGMIRITKSDIANFLIRHHQEQLSENEIRQIEADNFDEVRWMHWALNKIRNAKKEGRVITLGGLMAQRSQQSSNMPSLKKPRGRKPKDANKCDSVASHNGDTEDAPDKGSTPSSSTPNNQKS